MNYDLPPLAFMDQQLPHLTAVIEGQMRAQTGLNGAHPAIHPWGDTSSSFTGKSCGRFQKPGKAIEAT
jgi:hypothetical protein